MGSLLLWTTVLWQGQAQATQQQPHQQVGPPLPLLPCLWTYPQRQQADDLSRSKLWSAVDTTSSHTTTQWRERWWQGYTTGSRATTEEWFPPATTTTDWHHQTAPTQSTAGGRWAQPGGAQYPCCSRGATKAAAGTGRAGMLAASRQGGSTYCSLGRGCHGRCKVQEQHLSSRLPLGLRR